MSSLPAFRLFGTLTLCCIVLGCLSRNAAAQSDPFADGSKFAPGVLTTIEPDLQAEDVVSKHDVVELRADKSLIRSPKSEDKSSTLYEMSAEVPFRRNLWCLEFSFKPLRMTYVDVPQATGKMQRKLVWYLVYRVRNSGVAIGPQQQPDDSFTTAAVEAKPQRFVPQFVLASQDRNAQGKPIRKAYLDRILPAAMPVIERREMSGNKLLNSAEISDQLLAPESGRAVGGLWGVAVWEDVDPAIDFLSVYVGGLSNAYQWQDAPAGLKPNDPLGKGRRFFRKQLQLNFWRPGDTLAENEREIRFGTAPGYAKYYGTSEGVAHRWVYR